jgi:hypothetical protein
MKIPRDHHDRLGGPERRVRKSPEIRLTIDEQRRAARSCCAIAIPSGLEQRVKICRHDHARANFIPVAD